jgi:hypothetical protein
MLRRELKRRIKQREKEAKKAEKVRNLVLKMVSFSNLISFPRLPPLLLPTPKRRRRKITRRN